ncbi:glycosyltransferase, partial [Photobacterium lutimaris]
NITSLYINENINVVRKKNLFMSLFFTKKYNRVLFFGNLPPLVKCKSSILYIHNAYLVNKNSKVNNKSFKELLKNSLLKCYISFFKGNVSLIACQSRTMQEAFHDYYNYDISILPFYNELYKADLPKKYDFCFVGLPSLHKNHDFLLNCFFNLSNLNVSCKVALTVPIETRYKNLLEKIDHINEIGVVNIDNYGLIPYEKVIDIYYSSRSLVFPSSLESFGLPLIEAAMLDIPVFAPNLDYVNDVIDECNYININDVEDTVKSMKSYLIDSRSFKPARLKAENTFIQRFLHGSLDD